MVYLCFVLVPLQSVDVVPRTFEKGGGLLDSPPLQPHVDRQTTEFLQPPFSAQVCSLYTGIGMQVRVMGVFLLTDILPSTGYCRTDKPRMGNGIPR